MQYGLGESQEMIAATVRNFVEREIYPHEAEVERTNRVSAAFRYCSQQIACQNWRCVRLRRYPGRLPIIPTPPS